MTRTSHPLVCAVALALAVPTLAQIRVPGTPAALSSALPAPVPTVTVHAPDLEALRIEDRWREEQGIPGPLRYGALVPVDVGLETGGRFDVAPSGELVWRVRLESPGAFSVGLEFSEFRMPAGAQLFLYDDAHETVFGAYDATQESPDGSFVIEPFPGDSVVVEYKQPAHVQGTGSVRLRALIHDYRDVESLLRALEPVSGSGGGVTGGCVVGANCPAGAPYENFKRANVRTMFGGGLCSASLINNTAFDGTGYVYTANHCGQGSSTVFLFQYEWPNCESGTPPSNLSVSGATLLANNSPSDGRLLRINTAIPASHEPYFNGWNRGTTDPSFCVSFNHPGGGPKAVCIDSNGASKQTISVGGIGTVFAWFVDFNVGGLSGGSSGGGLADQNLRTIGAATAVNVFDCTSGFYGRFYEFWNSVNIAQYLDPVGSGALAIDGLDPLVPPACTVQGYGAGEVGSTGTLAVIGSSGGSPSVSNPSFTITLAGGVPNQTALLLEGPASASTPVVWGTMLIGGFPVIRHPGITSAAGTATYVVPMSPGLVGTTGFFQWLVRDPGFGGGAQHSGGLAVSYCP